MDEVLFRALREKVDEYLGAAERVLRDAEALPGRLELLPLVEAWRAVLRVHRPGRRGRCPVCDRCRWRRVGCTVWRTAYAHFVGQAPPRP